MTMGEVVGLFEDDIDITGWTEAQIVLWEHRHQRFATMARANAASAEWERENITPEVEVESQRHAEEFNREWDEYAADRT